MSRSIFRVLTHNIHKGMSAANLRFVLHELKAEIVGTGADVVFLQEVQGDHQRRGQRINNWPAESQFEFLADRAWPHHAYGRNAVYPHGHHGNAILSRFPIRAWENLNVSPYRGASRSILHAELDAGGADTLHAICTHFGLGAGERKAQTRSLIERIRAMIPARAPLVVAGDFNDWLGRSGEALEKDLGLTEVFRTCNGRHARTFPAWLPTLAVDRIYVRNLQIVATQRGNAAWRGLSDHLPLICDLQLGGPAS